MSSSGFYPEAGVPMGWPSSWHSAVGLYGAWNLSVENKSAEVVILSLRAPGHLDSGIPELEVNSCLVTLAMEMKPVQDSCAM